jgi:hypothetical protein
LTEDDKAKIRAMHLKVGIEKEAMNDPAKWQIQGMREVAADLGIEIKDLWIASDATGVAHG